jgi:hypothetical protein
VTFEIAIVPVEFDVLKVGESSAVSSSLRE